jgi:predicted nucleic acid-binding protein
MIVSDTGSLISAFQSGSFPLLHALIGDVVVPKAVADEIAQHGWSDELAAVGEKIRIVELAPDEQSKVTEIAAAIGTSDALEQSCELILIDELAARNCAKTMGLRIIGFPGILLMATRSKVINPDDLKSRLESCRDQGTYYGPQLIEDVYQMAQTVWRQS